jgi:hypothetical protein
MAAYSVKVEDLLDATELELALEADPFHDAAAVRRARS